MIPEENKIEKSKDIQPEENSFTKESLKKKFRLSEYLAEKLITIIAFFSIAIIILIFVFVFREAAPIFFTQKDEPVAIRQNDTGAEKNDEIEKTSSENTSQPERYGIEYSVAESEHQSDTNSSKNNKASTSGKNEEKPETYGIIEEKIETYGSFTRSEDTGKSVQQNPQSVAEEANASNKAALNSLGSKDWLPVSDNPRYGLLPLFIGTFKLTVIAILFAAPIGILSAIFTSCFAPKRLREIIKPVIELLAGFPSVVIGFFALMVMATFFQDLFGYSSRLNSFVGGIAMAMAAIPIIYTIAEDSLTAVPKSYIEASIALGASKWHTAFFVVLPAATPGIFAAVLLGIGRVFGETMIALMATGNAALISANPFDSVRALSATIGAEMAEVVFGDTHYNVLFLIGSMLFIFTFILNMLAEFYIKGKLMKRFQGQKA